MSSRYGRATGNRSSSYEDSGWLYSSTGRKVTCVKKVSKHIFFPVLFGNMHMFERYTY
jgi:hypothetical protein